jgi:hypothetical protein
MDKVVLRLGHRRVADARRYAATGCLVSRWLIAATLVLVTVAEGAETRQTIPEQFRGKWARTAAHCTWGGESTLTIGEMTVDGYESRGRVLAVAVDGETELAVLVEASGEGQVWLGALQFRLTDEGNTLTDVTGRRQIMTRTRCEPTTDQD